MSTPAINSTIQRCFDAFIVNLFGSPLLMHHAFLMRPQTPINYFCKCQTLLRMSTEIRIKRLSMMRLALAEQKQSDKKQFYQK